MKIKKKLIIIFAILILAILTSTKVQAASAKLSASSQNVTAGTKVTITTTIKGASWQVSISGAVTATYSDSTADAEDTTKTEKTSFTPSSAGTYKISLSGNVTGSNDTSATKVSDSITITVKEKTNTTGNNTISGGNTTGGGTTTTNLSSDATLSNLGIRPNDFSGFRKATTTYSVSVPKSVEKISIYATPTNSKAQVTGTGSKTLQIGKNTFSVKVTAEDKKTTKTYTLNITRKSEDEISTDATLSNLGIRPKEYDFTGFKANTTDYKVEVPNEVEKINIYATPTSSKAQVEGTGSQTLKVGQNTFSVKVTAEDKKATKNYTINVTRKDKEEEPEEPKEDEKKGIQDITVSGYTITPKFDEKVYNYKVDVTEQTNNLVVDVKASNNIETEIVGNENLKTGNNIITIMAKNKTTGENTTYQITATIGSKEVDLSTVNGAIDEAQKGLEIKKWIVRGTIILVIFLIIIYLLERYRLQRLEEEIYDDEETDEEDDDEEISETRLFYSQMNKDNAFNEDIKEENEEYKKKKSKYKGKRFKED